MLGSTHLYSPQLRHGLSARRPVMTTGLCELARRRAAHEPLGFDESLQGLTRNPTASCTSGGARAHRAVVVCPVRLRAAVGAQYFVPSLAVALWGGSAEWTRTDPGLRWMRRRARGHCLCDVVVAVPLIIDRHANASDAIRASLRATLFNLPAMLVWAVLIVGLTVLGFATCWSAW